MSKAFRYNVDVTPRLPGNLEDARHTLQRMAERRIAWAEIVAVVENPQRVMQGHSDRKSTSMALWQPSPSLGYESRTESAAHAASTLSSSRFGIRLV